MASPVCCTTYTALRFRHAGALESVRRLYSLVTTEGCNSLIMSNLDKAAQDHRAKQLNPNNPIYKGGKDPGYTGKGDKADLDHHAKQLNPNNPLYKGAGGKAAGDAAHHGHGGGRGGGHGGGHGKK